MNRPLRVFIASHACAVPANQQLFAIAAARRGWQVTLCVPRVWIDEYGNSLPARLLDGFDARLIALPVWRNGSVPQHVYRGQLRTLLRSIDPDVIYSHNEAYAASTIQWCLANRLSIRKPFGFFSCQNLVKRYPTPFRQGEQFVYRSSEFFFPITAAVETAHREKGYRNRSVVLPLGYDGDTYLPSGDVAGRHLSRGDRPFRIIYAGRLVEEKGLLTAAKALSLVSDLDWRLIVAGSGPFEQDLRTSLEEGGVASRVDWKGFVPRDQMPSLLESADVLLLPSETRLNWKEQFGRVLIEAMACGTPVIGSSSGEIPTIIRQTEGGMVFDEGDANQLADRIRRLMDDGARSDIATRAAQYVRTHYSLASLADLFATTIESSVPKPAHEPMQGLQRSRHPAR